MTKYIFQKKTEKVLTTIKKVRFDGRSPDKFWLEDSTPPFIISVLSAFYVNIQIF